MIIMIAIYYIYARGYKKYTHQKDYQRKNMGTS